MSSEKFTYRDSFEQLLQEAADRFRLYPSPKIWQGLYNNIHPSKRKPSTTSLLLISYFFLLLSAPSGMEKETKSSLSVSFLPHKESNQICEKAARQAGIQALRGVNKKSAPFLRTKIKKDAFPVDMKAEKTEKNYLAFIPAEKNEQIMTWETSGTEPEALRPALTFGTIFFSTGYSAEQKNQETPSKAPETNSRFQYQVYATPSMEFRESHPGSRTGEQGSSSAESFPEDASNNSGLAAFNIEAGGNILFRFNPDLRFKAGLQVNYSNRQVQANQGSGDAPETARILANSLQSISGKDLNAESFQFSIPLGADWMIAGNDAVQWFAGATVQPSFLLPGNNNLIIYGPETPVRHDPGSFRNFNINGGIETFVSFKTPGGITLNAGPQFRYQMLSSYKNMYPYNERLFNIGLKLGITSPF